MKASLCVGESFIRSSSFRCCASLSARAAPVGGEAAAAEPSMGAPSSGGVVSPSRRERSGRSPPSVHFQLL
eukprot:6527706-Prymnesium_polylepis.1